MFDPGCDRIRRLADLDHHLDAVRRGRVTTIAVSIMIAWHLVADVEMGITLGILAWLLWPGKAA